MMLPMILGFALGWTGLMMSSSIRTRISMTFIFESPLSSAITFTLRRMYTWSDRKTRSIACLRRRQRQHSKRLNAHLEEPAGYGRIGLAGPV